ncbi:hypothetical protein MUK42_33375, partial [Musa troglodytarum]
VQAFPDRCPDSCIYRCCGWHSRIRRSTVLCYVPADRKKVMYTASELFFWSWLQADQPCWINQKGVTWSDGYDRG